LHILYYLAYTYTFDALIWYSTATAIIPACSDHQQFQTLW